jgi:hypothetical protein
MADVETNSEDKEEKKIRKAKRRVIPHIFKIKHSGDEQRDAYAKLVLELVRKYQLKEFYIDEDLAYKEPRISYNAHTLGKGDKITYEEIEKKFVDYLI